MRVILWQRLLEMARIYSTTNGACEFAVMAGLIYHFTCQYPAQREVMTCLYVIGSFNGFFLATALLGDGAHSFFKIGALLLVFNVVYVIQIPSSTDLRF